MKYGLNLYSIRSLIQTKEDYINTSLKLRDMGFSYVQYSGAPLDVDKIQATKTVSGLDVVLTHVPMERILYDTDQLLKEHEAFGCYRIGLGMMPLSIILDEKKCFETIDKLNKAAKYMAERGFKFFYHHHHYEFLKYGDQTIFDYILENATYINFTIDTYWLQYGGVEILSFLDKVKGRTDCVHLKDYQLFVETNKVNPNFAPIGDGTLDFKKIIKKMKEVGVKYFLVEQDNADDFDNPLHLINKSIQYLKETIEK